MVHSSLINYLINPMPKYKFHAVPILLLYALQKEAASLNIYYHISLKKHRLGGAKVASISEIRICRRLESPVTA